MLKVLVASSKGGAGKTTIATNLAAHYAVDGKNTVLVDADRQGSSQRWAEKRAGMPQRRARPFGPAPRLGEPHARGRRARRHRFAPPASAPGEVGEFLDTSTP